MPRLTLSSRPVLSMALLYLALPFMLFLWGWLRWWAALPLMAATGYGLYAVIAAIPQEKRHLTWRGAGVTALMSVGCLILTLACGFTGHVQQHADFIIRNAVYEGLITHDWPLILPDGQSFIYYIGHWLSPAAAAKACPAYWADALLILWTFLGLELALLTAVCQWGARKTMQWGIILFCLSAPLAAFDYIGLAPAYWAPGFNAQMTQTPPIITQIFNTFNHAVPALLCVTLTLTRSLPRAGYFLAGSWLLLCSPLAGLCLLPFLFYEGVCRKDDRHPDRMRNMTALLKSPALWIACAGTALLAVFYYGLDGGGRFICLFSAGYGELFHYGIQQQHLFPAADKYLSFAMAMALNVLLPAALLYPACRRMPLYYLCMGMMAATLFCRTGIMNNELMLKAPAVLFPVLALLFHETHKHPRAALRPCIALYLILVAIPPIAALTEKMATFTTAPATIQSHRQSPSDALSNPNSPTYRQFIKADGKQLPPWLFKTNAER